MSFGSRLKSARIKKMLTQKELSDIIGAKHNSISNWENDRNRPDTDTITKLCKILSVSPTYLISGDDGESSKVESLFASKKRFCLLGDIACGEPIFAQSEPDNFIEASNIDADFCLRAKGDSMTGARIYDGDIVFIRSQPVLENGEIGAVLIDNEATLKRVYVNDKTVTLLAENPAYPPLVYDLSACDDVRILGKAVAFFSEL